VIEHNLDVIKTADWVIDLGPDGGHRGGEIIAQGTPEEIAAMPQSHTGRFLAPLLDAHAGMPAAVGDKPAPPRARGRTGTPTRGRRTRAGT
jgi:excinuclease ABC subunit A